MVGIFLLIALGSATASRSFLTSHQRFLVDLFHRGSVYPRPSNPDEVVTDRQRHFIPPEDLAQATFDPRTHHGSPHLTAHRHPQTTPGLRANSGIHHQTTRHMTASAALGDQKLTALAQPLVLAQALVLHKRMMRQPNPPSERAEADSVLLEGFHGQTGAAFATASGQHGATTTGFHAGTETVAATTLDFTRLICALGHNRSPNNTSSMVHQHTPLTTGGLQKPAR